MAARVSLRAGALGALAMLAALSACRGGSTLGTTPTGGSREVIENTEVHLIPRAANGRDYRITVGLPDSYAAQPERRYPVMYVLDGYWDFKLLKSIVGGVVYDRVIPEIILVGLGYPGDKPDYDRLRRWDLTPVPDPRPENESKGESGHAPELLQVLEREIIPLVDGRYRTDTAYRVLGGSSMGGLFALYTLFSKPGLFHAYVAPSPAVGYANNWLFGYEEAFARRGEPFTARLYMTAAEKEDAPFVDAIKRFDARLRERAYPGLAYEFRIVEGERHSGTKPEAFNRGVRFAFAPRAPL